MGRRIGLLLLFIFLSLKDVFSQNNRAIDANHIGWNAFFLNYALNDKWSMHGEFQWRRTEFIKKPQQNLYRTGLNLKLNPSVIFRFGYLYADTFNYGQIPISSLGMEFPEHRTYQMFTLNNPIGRIQVSHRFMLEQRWLGSFSDKTLERPDDYVYLNRARYMARIDIPLKGTTIGNGIPYIAAYDELMIGFGKNVNQNVFDQNRIGILTGYRFSNQIRVEGGYFNQIVQLGRLVEGKNVFQGNRGYIINTYFNF
ncbi:DUF2490 domain-containing protein [Cecembia sp.]|uniref:DUF2490 domain-containing protein n=1 Tax=Cecembia sp. TaxID=1898110 RepID=UPI0025C34EB7|nr:DUF2490 domain-containing protein [Cecembia sp.]